MTGNGGAELARAWERNAANWTRAVRGEAIASRRAGTDAAIVDAILRHAPARLLDVGCGEGWLIRRVVQHRPCACVGIDGCAELVAAAQALDPAGTYRVARYEDLAEIPDGPFDAVVFNFALFDEATDAAFAAVVPLLSATGVVIIQTLHPCFATAEAPYSDGWRCEDFAAFAAAGQSAGEAWAPMPWFFRTLESWHAVIRSAGLVVSELAEPPDPVTKRPLSLLLSCARERR